MPSKDIQDCDPKLISFWYALKKWYQDKFPAREIFLTCTYRSPAEQAEIFAKNKPGIILTRCDGAKVKSKHNYKPARALDCAISENGKVKWQEDYYSPIGDAIKELGYSKSIRWGGVFSFSDPQHIELL